MSSLLVLLLCSLLWQVPVSTQGALVWWEGEKPTQTNFPSQTWFSAQPGEKDKLSGGAWLTNIDQRKPGQDEAFAKYQVTVPSDGKYHLWVRKFWKHGPFRWRFDQMSWEICSRNVELADSVGLRQHVVANWVYLGQVKLKKGKRDFEIRLLAKEGESLTAAFDCFVLSESVFVPNGKNKPGEKLNRADPGFFAWEPNVDPFEKAVLDLRYLNEKSAGMHGHIRKNAAGNFTLGNGVPVRFWAVNLSTGNIGQNRESVDYLARKLAKLGVNMVRFHSPIFQSGADPARVDLKKLDDLHYMIKAMREQGIYTSVSFYFPLWFGIKQHYGLPGYDPNGQQKPFALLFFNQRMQEIHRSWLKTLLTQKNPYTGKSIAKDPAVAMVEVLNEDSLFFWTFSKRNIPKPYWQELEKLYAQWLKKKYGSIQAAHRAWGNASNADDAPSAGRMGLYEIWHLTGEGLEKSGNASKRKRLADQVTFLTELQRGFYEKTIKYMKENCGFEGLVVASNWHTADPARLGPLERYTYTAGDVMDRHGYFGSRHQGEGSSYSVRQGHQVGHRSALKHPEDLPIHFDQVKGFPQIISEINWPHPNRYRADMMMLAAAYGSLQDVDGFYWFAVRNNYLSAKTMSKFQIDGPLSVLSMPGNALMYRRGDIKVAKPVYQASLKMRDLYGLKGVELAAAQALDQLRQKDSGSVAQSSSNGLDPRLYLVGPVIYDYQGKQTRVSPWQKFIDHPRKQIKSQTGELSLNWGEGILEINSPKAQGVAGFLKEAGELKLDALSINSGNEYGAVLVIALDDQPIRRSKKLLVQLVTETRPYGYREQAGRITHLGSSPWGVKEIDLTIQLKGWSQARALVLNTEGQPDSKKTVKITRKRGAITINIPKDAPWIIIQR